jgi:hypothetical protein
MHICRESLGICSCVRYQVFVHVQWRLPAKRESLLESYVRRRVGLVVETIVLLFIMRVSLFFGAKLTNVSSSKEVWETLFLVIRWKFETSFQFLWPKKRANKLSHTPVMHKRVCETVACTRKKKLCRIAWESKFYRKCCRALEESVGEKIVGTLETVTCNTRQSSTMGDCSMQMRNCARQYGVGTVFWASTSLLRQSSM